MKLSELRAGLVRHGVILTVTEDGKLRPHAAKAPPPELVEAIRMHRDALLLELTRGRAADGRLDVMWLATRPGRCGTCVFWRGPDAYGDGQCRLGRAAHGWWGNDPLGPVTTTIHHSCGAREGRGWRRKP